MKARKQTREERIRLLEHIVDVLHKRLEHIESIIFEQPEKKE